MSTLKEEVVRLNAVVDAYERKTSIALEENRILKLLVDEQKANLGRVEADNKRVEQEAEAFKVGKFLRCDYASQKEFVSVPPSLPSYFQEKWQTK